MRLTLPLILLLVAIASPTRAQIDAGGAAPPDPSTLVHASSVAVELAAGASGEVAVQLAIQPSWHINSNPPSPDYMIPTSVEIRPGFGVTPGRAVYPEAQQLKVEFDDKPLSVYSGTVTVRVPLAVASAAMNGAHVLEGFVRYQSCNDQVCTRPTTIPFTVSVRISGGVAAGSAKPGGPDTSVQAATADSTATSAANGGGGAGAQPLGTGTRPLGSVPGAGLSGNPIADALAKGGFGAFVALFLIGLALNLTPCVYPMFGVTVSIFGARSAAPTIKVLGSALVYVLGMTTMYSVLGVVAALTGGLFGAFLQNPLVLLGIGVLLIGMSLSMFGLYELQPPPALLQRLGGAGATNVIGLFVSGLVVGVFAAPCVGPPVVALLAIVAAKADPWFGFRTFFTLAVGLGAPYLVLGTFSNLLQKLPRSGDWMIWVKQVFGVILASVGLFYALLAVAPRFAAWVAPAALLIGGLYLGFVENSAAKRRGFVLLKRVTGVAALAAGVWLVAAAPRQALVFQPYDAAAVERALASGRPVILDFSADWCIPCHELERSTFTDARVISAASGFATFKVDLTHSDSPEATEHTRRFRIQGVPTVVFLTPRGGEVEAARFSGFLPPAKFLEKLELAAAAANSSGRGS
jgi:thiol:disulfide interchange protein DsbD